MNATLSPAFSLNWQPPTGVDVPLTEMFQYAAPPASTFLIVSTESSSKDGYQVPSQVKCRLRAASSRAAVGVGTAVGLAPPLVPSHLCVPPVAVVTS